MSSVDERLVKRRLRKPLSCQRCRKHRSKCSRERPACEQCLIANVECEYLDAPGDLASTALRSRFSTLQDQIDSLMNEFGLIEQLVYTRDPIICTDALRSWDIKNDTGQGVSIDTHMHHVEDIYAVLLQFALDNNKPSSSSSSTASSSTTSSASSSTTRWLTRNNTIYPNIKLSHFTSLLPGTTTASGVINDALSPTPSTPTSPSSPINISASQHDIFLKTSTIQRLLELYPTCLLHGSILGFQPIHDKLLDRKLVTKTPVLRLLYTSCMCYMLLHACYWHPEMIETNLTTANVDQQHYILQQQEQEDIKSSIITLAQNYYEEAKELVSTLYFEQESANVIICHAICNLVLYHIESGNISIIYLYSGMAAQLAASLDIDNNNDCDGQQQQLVLPFDHDNEDDNNNIEDDVDGIVIPLESSSLYIRSIRWFIYSMDTSASHFHNKPYEVQLEDQEAPPFPNDGDDNDEQQKRQRQQRIFQWLEYKTCEITRDIRRTCFSNDRQQVPYKEIERIEKKLIIFESWLRRYTNDINTKDDVWSRRCLYMHSVRYYGHWILLHQTYIPTPLSIERCSKAAFALVDLFDAWQLQLDCYFRPCIHELKQACEILEYLVDQENQDEKLKALNALSRLLKVILHTPVDDIARTRPFIQKVQRILTSHNMA